MKSYHYKYYALFLILLSVNSFSKTSGLVKEAVLDEIQKTFIKDYGVDKSYWYQPKRKKTKQTSAKRSRSNTKRNGIFSNKPLPRNTTKVEIKAKKKLGWMASKMDQENSWKKKKVEQTNAWQRNKIKLISKWRRAKKKYRKKIPVYKSNLYSFKSIKKTVSKSIKKSVNTPATPIPNFGRLSLPKMVIIPGAFSSKVLDQGNRPTCSAFAATRAIEIILSRKKSYKAISPQYVYYASKPKCQSSKCTTKGSWPRSFFQKSLTSLRADIPTLRDCPYSTRSLPNNETQIPLKRGCFKGRYKINDFAQTTNFNEIRQSLKNGDPVIGGFRLSPNFYKNKGVVFYKDSKKRGKTDSHSAGHAILFVGYMKIPPSLNEGAVCLIASNSWGKGWGVGGFSCLSERWIKEYAFHIPFLALKSVN